MRGINLSRVVLGGLLAGLVIDIGEFLLNGVLFAEEMQQAAARLNLPPVGGGAIAVFMVMGFALGIAMIWVYAAIRPRFGPGVRTALCAGAVTWFLAYAYASVGYGLMGIFPARLLIIGSAWGLMEMLAASVAGAWLYQETGTAATQRAHL
jgi:hypothetical protein